MLAAALTLGAALAVAPAARAQSIEPRLFSNAPIGLNFLIVGYAYSSGAVVLDPTRRARPERRPMAATSEPMKRKKYEKAMRKL